jgi:hypothetical protein
VIVPKIYDRSIRPEKRCVVSFLPGLSTITYTCVDAADYPTGLDAQLSTTLCQLLEEKDGEVARGLASLETVGIDHELADMPVYVLAHIKRRVLAIHVLGRNEGQYR